MTVSRLLPVLVFAAGLAAQTIAVFPPEYANVPEGPFQSPNLPLADGTSRVQCVYDRRDVGVPSGALIRRLGFREDATTTTMDPGRSLQLEVWMGYTTAAVTGLSSTFSTNYAAPPTTVFGPALFALPNLRDPANPLPNGQFFLTLTTPFQYAPAANQNLVVEYRVLGTSGGGSAFNYRLDRADYYSPTATGPAGCPHSGGHTAALTFDPVRAGIAFNGALSSGPGNSFAVLVVATGTPLATPYSLQALLPGIAPACMGQVPTTSAFTLSNVTSSSGTANFFFQVPNNPVLFNHMLISGQCVLFDFFAPGGAAVSNGAQVQIGIQPRTAILAAQGPPSTVTTGSVNPSFCPVAFFDYQ